MEAKRSSTMSNETAVFEIMTSLSIKECCNPSKVSV
jgi:hypothetical protein